MAIEPVNASFYADPAALSALKRESAAQSPEALRETAKQFESLFTTMLMKSMRAASPGDPYGSDQQDFYQDMFDQQLATQLSKGKGLGLADVLVRQLIQGNSPEAAVNGLSNPGAKELKMPGAKDAAGYGPFGISASDRMPAGSGAGGAAASGGSATDTTATDTTAAEVTAADTTAVNWPPRNAAEFVRAIRPAATAAARELGVDADTIIAHAALETGWGRSVPTGADGTPSFNLFGVKAGSSWRGAVSASRTNEFIDGRMAEVRAGFRAYDSPQQSMQDYVGLLKGSPRYAAALNTGSNVTAFARGLQRGGYATDPDYVNKLAAVAARLKIAAPPPIA